MTNHERFYRKHPSLQLTIEKWIVANLPNTGAALEERIMMPSGYYMTIAQVSMYMASAAMAVLEVSCSAAGLDGS